jgi:hypothetical protein
LACNKLGSKNKWFIEEKIFVKQGPNTRKIWSANDIISQGPSA